MPREFEGIFVGVGKLEDFQAKLNVAESVQPIAQKLRASAFGLRETIEQKLELVSHENIESVEGLTPWVSPVVIVPKPFGDIRRCVRYEKS